MNVLLLTIDSLRFDRVTDRVMPATRSFADDATEFTQCIANGPSTPASFPAIHASRHFGSIQGIGIPPSDNKDDIRTLAEVLASTGYETAGYTDNHFASGSYHYDRGFKTMYDASGRAESGRLKQFVQSNLDKDGVLFKTIETLYNRVDALIANATGNDSEYERAEHLNERALDWIDGQSGDWFTWLHYMDAHHPYEAPPDYQRQFLEEPLSLSRCRGLSRKGTHHPAEMTDADWALIRGLYNAECAYVDDQIATLLQSLQDRNVLEETMVIITADHGELIGEHGHAGHPPQFWEGIIRVPLIIAHPDWNTTTVDGQVRLLDIAPTVAEGIGVDPYEGWHGQSMVEVLNGEVSAREHAFADVGREIDYSRSCVRRADGWKLMRHGEDGTFCFDLSESPSEQPEDQRDAEECLQCNQLATKLDEHQNEMAAIREQGTSSITDNETMVEEHLKDLGYR